MASGKALRAITDLRPGDHLCCLYETEEEHRAVLTPFLRAGLEASEKVLYIIDQRSAETVLGYLRDTHVEVEPYLVRGQLQILAQKDTYLRDGQFDPDRMISMLGEEVRKAIEEGYSALRVTGEMSWALSGQPGSERLIEYENRLNDFFHGNPCLAICQYDRRCFDPVMLLDVLRAHPLAVIGTEVYGNFYYVPPDELLGGSSSALLDRWIGNLRERKLAREQLQRERNLMAAILDTSGALIIVLDCEGRIVRFNRTCEQITGHTFGEVKGRFLVDILPSAEEAEGMRQLFQNLELGRFPMSYVSTWASPDGVQRRLAWSNTALCNERGSLQYIIATGLDITEKEQAEIARGREISSLEELSGPPKAAVTADAFGVLALSRADPEGFESHVARLHQILELALNERCYRVEQHLSEHLRDMAYSLGISRVGPRDVVEIYVTALKQATAGLHRQKAAVYADEGRLILVELMGYLTSFYRDRSQEPVSTAKGLPYTPHRRNT